MFTRLRLGVGLSLACLVLGIVLSSAAFAGENTSGTFGAPFLRIPVGAKLTAVPEVVVGLRPDPSLVFSDPSAAARITETGVFVSTSKWLDDLNLSAASVVVPTGLDGVSWSVGTRMLYSGGIEGFNNTGDVVTEEDYYDLALTSGVTAALARWGVAFGVAATYIREQLGVQKGDGMTFTAGASYERGTHRLLLSALDLGGNLAFQGGRYPFESRVLAGYAHSMSRTWGTLHYGGQIMFSRAGYERLELGVGYRYNRYLTLRTGVHRALNAPEQAGLPIAAGLGFHYGRVVLDYAFAPHEYFPGSHTFSATFGFGGDSPQKREQR